MRKFGEIVKILQKFMNLKRRGKIALANDVLKNAAFGTNFNVIMTSQNNVKSNVRYAMTSIFARGPV